MTVTQYQHWTILASQSKPNLTIKTRSFHLDPHLQHTSQKKWSFVLNHSYSKFCFRVQVRLWFVIKVWARCFWSYWIRWFEKGHITVAFTCNPSTQEAGDYEFKSSLGYIMRTFHIKKKNHNKLYAQLNEGGIQFCITIMKCLWPII